MIGDLQGPKLRVGVLPAEGVALARGSVAKLQWGRDRAGVIPVQHNIARYLKRGQPIYLQDGKIELSVISVDGDLITARVMTPGTLTSNQGINLPDADLGGDILTRKDLQDIDFAAEHNLDYLAVSFVQRAEDITRLKRRLVRMKAGIGIIAKIETKAAVANIEEIVAASDGVMVARGDLAVEMRPEAVPIIQQQVIDLARKRQRFVIVATQMLESMIKAPTPTRAEVSDVANAVREGADAVMTSGETAVGLYPSEVVEIMKRVICYTESHTLAWKSGYDFGDPAKASAISAAAIILASQIKAKLIIAETSTGQTARNLASLRPPVPIIMVTHQQHVYQQLAIIWGGKSYFQANPSGATDEVIAQLQRSRNVVRGDYVVVARGHQPGVAGGTDTVQVRVVT
jgi:pyruvate kinase